MTDQECNKIIAEYMGVPFCPCNMGVEVEAHDFHPKYTESLDALVSVWVKLDSNSITLEIFPSGSVYCSLMGQTVGTIGNDMSIQLAAAHTTARSILKIKRG